MGCENMIKSNKLHKKCKQGDRYISFTEEFNHNINNKHVKSKKIDLSRRKKLFNHPEDLKTRDLIIDLLFGN